MAKKKLTNKAKRDKQRIKTHQDAKRAQGKPVYEGVKSKDEGTNSVQVERNKEWGRKHLDKDWTTKSHWAFTELYLKYWRERKDMKWVRPTW